MGGFCRWCFSRHEIRMEQQKLSTPLYVGNYGINGGGQNPNVYISDVRIYKGSKYTSDFVPASTNPDIISDTPSGLSGKTKLTKITDGVAG